MKKEERRPNDTRTTPGRQHTGKYWYGTLANQYKNHLLNMERKNATLTTKKHARKITPSGDIQQLSAKPYVSRRRYRNAGASRDKRYGISNAVHWLLDDWNQYPSVRFRSRPGGYRHASESPRQSSGYVCAELALNGFCCPPFPPTR
jgi:hypothetical protein